MSNVAAPLFPPSAPPDASAGRRALIVGAGPGGLAAAMLLAHADLEVTVLERRDRVGGRTSALEADGFRFDLGPTFFLYPQVLRGVFRMVGRDLDREVELIRLDPQYELRYEDGARVKATPDLDRLEREIARLNPHDATQIRAYMDANRAKLNGFKPILENAFQGWGDFLRLPFKDLLPLMQPGRSVEGDLRKYFDDPRVRLAFSFQSKYLGMSPFRCPSLFTILAFLEYEHGVFHPVGGCAAVTEAMARVARSMGVDIRLNEGVEEILFEGQRAVGVRTASGHYASDALVVNADFAAAMKKLVPDELRRRWKDKRLERKKYSCSTFMLYLGIEGLYDELAHHTILLADDYREGLADIEQRHVLSKNPSVYVQNAGVTDRTLAPHGHSTLYVLAPVTHQHPNVDWAQETSAFRRRILDRLANHGLADLESRIRYEKVLTPAGWEADHQIFRGATFNLAHNLGQMLHLRPRNRFDELEGVYLVGGGTHPGSGLPVIFESAKITSRLMVQDLGVEAAWHDDEAVPMPLPSPERVSSLAS